MSKRSDSIESVWNRRISRRRVVGAGLAITGVATLAGCAAPAATPTPVVSVPTTGAAPAATSAPAAPAATATAVVAQPKRGGILNFIGVRVANFDVQATTTTGLSGQFPGFCYSRLLRYKVGPGVVQPSFVVEGDLAQSWDQPDDTTLIFKLKQNAKWHNKPPANGRAVNAEDIVFSYSRMRDQKVNAGLIDSIDTFTAVDPQTVRMVLKRPDPDVLVNLGHIVAKIVNRETVDQRGDLKSGDIIGTGAWMTKPNEPLDPETIGTVYRNPDYYETGQPYLDGWKLNAIIDASTRNSALRTRQLDLDVIINDATTIEATRKAVPQLVLTRVRGIGPIEFGVQASDGPTKDVRVRQAIQKALDRKAAVQAIGGGIGFIPQMIPLPDQSWGFSDTEIENLFKADLTAAKRLMGEAGFANGFALKTAVSNASNGLFVNAAEWINAALKQINIDVQIESIDNTGLVDRLNRGAFESWCTAGTALGSTTPGAELTSRYLTGATRNVQKVSDPKLDDLIRRQSSQARDVEGRKRTLQDIQRYLINDQPSVYPIIGIVHDWLSWPNIKAITPGVYAQTEHWNSLLWLDS